MSIKFSFDSDALLDEIKEIVETEIKDNPAQFLTGHEGEEYSGKCPECGHDTAVIISDGYAQCPKCKHTAKVSFDVLW